MDKLSIKVNIGGRTYPLTIAPSEEEAIRKAAQLINDNIRQLEENYAVRDKQDVLAMTALQYANQVVEGRKGTADDEAVTSRIQELDSLVSDYLSRQT